MRLPRIPLLVLTLAAGLIGGQAHAQLRIGMPSGFTGAVAAGVKENAAGADLYFDAVNARGGVHGQKIELIKADDQFNPKRTPEVSRELIEKNGVLALFLNRGTPHSQALLPLLAEYKVPLVAPSTGAMLLHEPVNPWVFNVRATYQREAARAIEHLGVIGLTRLGLFVTDDSFGADAAVGALKGFDKAKLTPAFNEKFARENPDLDGPAARVKANQVQAVMVVGSVTNVVNFVKALRQAGSQAQVVTLSNNASEGFIKQLGDQARGVVVSQVFPNERSMAYPLIKEAIELAKAKGQDGVSPAMMEGFAAAKVVVEGLRRAGPNPTRQTLRSALESIEGYDIGGLTITYGPRNHTGLDFADLSIIDHSGRFRR